MSCKDWTDDCGYFRMSTTSSLKWRRKLKEQVMHPDTFTESMHDTIYYILQLYVSYNYINII